MEDLGIDPTDEDILMRFGRVEGLLPNSHLRKLAYV